MTIHLPEMAHTDPEEQAPLTWQGIGIGFLALVAILTLTGSLTLAFSHFSDDTH